MGWGYRHHHHHHHHGIGRAVAEAAVLGTAAIAGAAVATAVASRPAPPPRREVVVVPGGMAPVVGATAPVVLKGKGKGKGKGMEIIQVPPLGVSAVGIPASAISKHEGVTFFGIDVVPEQGASYRVQKRYNDFDKLKDSLNYMAPGSRIATDFPPKHLLSCEGPKLEDRRHGLERWLTRVLNDAHSRGLWCLELRQFLEVDGVHTIHTLPATDPAPVLAPSAPAELEGEVLQIVIPAGVSSGQALSVNVPDGRQLTFEIPPGVMAGSRLQLWYDPVAGTVSPLV
mmetsp:Transcript_50461/g.61877  ORF Transcript_50461/g.61877 Transcript_50461/m.61877 type:complete len:284 (-) Transcript_50461:247-1098(-)